ncbi:anillin-like [Leptopilina boulardi]|uniref:anillin-like n=1 Tax=Leptopilina boulardi TaxID=63433 RepID=UPI0021F5586C|nr:anillin-like [Leptopilina boulardi]
MDEEQEQFTRRMLRRAGLKKGNNEEVSNFSSLRRKLNILRAIENNNSQDEQSIDNEEVEKRKFKITKKESKIRLKKNANNIINNETSNKKNNCITSTSWSKIPANYFESLNSSTINITNDSPKNLTIDEFFQKNQFSELKNDDNMEKSQKFEKENLSQLSDTSSKNNSKICQKNDDNESSSHVEWEDTVKKCINNYFESMNKKGIKNLDTQINDDNNLSKTISSLNSNNILSPKSNFLQKMITTSSEEFISTKNCVMKQNLPISPKEDLSLKFFSPRSEFLFSKSEFTSPDEFLSPKQQENTEYFSTQNIDFSKNDIKINDKNNSSIIESPKEESQKLMENSINDLSLSTFVKGLDNENIQYLEIKNNNWNDAIDFFDNNKSPELLKVTCKMIDENNTDIIIPNDDIKITKLPNAESISKNLENLNDETQSIENESLDLSSIIDNLDEEIKNLEIQPDVLKKSLTPKQFFQFPISPKSLVTSSSSLFYTPRKLFNQSIQESEEIENKLTKSISQETKNESINKNEELIEKNQESIENNIEKENKFKEEIIETPINEMDKKKFKQKSKKNTKTEIESTNFVRRNSSFFRFKTPMPWRTKPNLESTRKSSNYDLTKKTTTTTNSPSHIESIISSINPNSPATPDDNEKKSQRISDCSISFEVEKFLEEALGEELYCTSMTYGLDKTNSNLDATELLSGDRTSLNNSLLLNSSRSENRQQHFSRHSTLNRTISAYRSLSKRIKKKFRPSLKETMKQVWNPILPISNELNEKLQPLIQEVNIQQTRIYQASKALDYCRSMKMFQASPEQVESDRLLLIATLKKQALFHEIKAIASSTKVETSFIQQAEIVVDNFSLTLKDIISEREREKNIVEWFVIVVSQGLTVWSTQAVTCPIDEQNKKIPFTGSIKIPNLNPDFKILVRVFSTKFHISNAEKIHVKNLDRDTTCPSPTKLLKRSERSVSMRSHEIKFSGIRETSFILQGYVELQVHDLSLYPPWPLLSMPRNSVLHNSIDLTIKSHFDVGGYHSGFLNYGDEMGGYAVWNRRWCVLEKHMLMFWNYPREQEVKPPLLTINLMESLNDHVTTISRTLCARPRTFVIEVSRQRTKDDRNSGVMELRPSCTIIKHLLQCDSLHDLMEWKTKLNHILAVFREWNVKGH